MLEAGHILNDKRRIAGNVRVHMRSRHAGVEIVGIPGRQPYYNPDGFTLIKLTLSMEVSGAEKQEPGSDGDNFHNESSNI
jgi:hypothetical protein